ncbi:hypothetical protein SAMN05444972_11639 [Marininema halotolerans]|uniref:Uncharacterized protein n=1 Tax=Marininema halotolerans TaxID=1155944 RepID=A0A1I6UGD8_9BACL|nr:hypothetical protein SAMN05444972_11639 [Marininema halotolerans]
MCNAVIDWKRNHMLLLFDHNKLELSSDYTLIYLLELYKKF